jgi:hypothetical protein
MKFFSVIFTAALATAVLAAPVDVAERQVEAQFGSKNTSKGWKRDEVEERQVEAQFGSKNTSKGW